MMHILLNVFNETKGKVVVPEIISKRSLKYLTETHDILKWFYANYERIVYDSDKQNILKYISIKDIVSRLKKLTYFQELNVTIKLTVLFINIKDLLKNNELLNDDYVESIYRTVDNVRIHKYNLL